MAPMLPVELLQSLSRSVPCREHQLWQLATLYNNRFPAPPVLVVYGLDATGKNAAVEAVLDARQIPSATVKCIDCLSLRHLLSRIFVACVKATGQLDALEQHDRVDSLNSLVLGLQKLLQNYGQKVVLVLDGIDRQRGASPTLLPAIARLGETVPNISVILTSSSPRPLYLQKAGVPHLYFPPYTRSELISLVTSHPPPDLAPLSRTSADTATLRKLHLQFASIVYDSVVGPTASTSLPVFRSTCSKLWPRFIWPYISSEQPPGKARSWDFARLLVRNRALFQTEAEQILSERLGPRRGAWTFEELEAAATATATAALASAPDLPLTETTTAINSPTPATPPLLKHFSALLLISSYLASHTPPKLDILLFSRLSASSKSNRIRKSYHRRKLFQSPSSTAAAAASSAKTSRSSSTFDLKLNIPRPFSLERLLAIVRAIHPHGVPNQKSIADRVYRHLAELERLRLVVPAGGGAGAYDDDEKWRVNVNREWIEDIGRQWGIGLSEFEVGGS